MCLWVMSVLCCAVCVFVSVTVLYRNDCVSVCAYVGVIAEDSAEQSTA